MITFGSMSVLASSLSRQSRWCLVLAGAIVVLTRSGGAQAPLSHTEDASPVARGSLRFSITTAWTRYDERFAAGGGTSPLGADLSTPALGVAQLPLLAPTEASLQALAGDPTVRLSLGRLDVRGGARIVTMPIALEYGVTRRLSIGLQVPVVQTRRVIQARVNSDTSALANVGFVPDVVRQTAAAQNLAVANAFNNDANRLTALITQCSANPSAAGCAPVDANPAGAAAARDQARAYATAVSGLGVDAANALLAPRAGSALYTSIEARRQTINTALQQFLGAGAGSASGVFAAPTSFSYIDLQGQAGSPGLLQSVLGGGLDSLHTSDRLGIGDIAVGARYLLFDRFVHDSQPAPPLQWRMMVGGAMRFATSQADSARDLIDIAPGEGAGVELQSAMDLLRGRFGGTIAARYVKALARVVTAPVYGDPESVFPYPVFAQRSRTAGDVAGVDLTPRYFFSDWLAVDALYGFERVGATRYSSPDTLLPTPCPSCLIVAVSTIVPPIVTTSGSATTVQRLGLGFRFSTVAAYARGQSSFPVEVSFAHLESVTGSPGVPKASRDQIQLRIYYRLRRAD